MTIALLLAGGNSSRFKFGDKATYQNFPERCFETLSALTETVFVSAKLSNLTELQNRLPQGIFLLDQAPYLNQGPLSALYALVDKHSDKSWDLLILSVDNPEISVASLKLLLAQPNAYVENYFTIAHLTSQTAQLQDYLASGNRRILGFLQLLKAVPISISETELIDHNRQ